MKPCHSEFKAVSDKKAWLLCAARCLKMKLGHSNTTACLKKKPGYRV